VCYARAYTNAIVGPMKLLLLVLALALASCTSLQSPASVDQETAQRALVEVLRLASAGLDADDFASLALTDLLDHQSVHLVELKDIPLFEQRLEVWGKEVIAAFWHSASRFPLHLEPLFEGLTFPEAKAMVDDNTKTATQYFSAQHHEQIVELARLLLVEELAEASSQWSRIAGRYHIVRNSHILLEEHDLGAITDDLFEHLVELFVHQYLSALAEEELQLRTTPVIKGSGSFLEIFQ